MVMTALVNRIVPSWARRPLRLAYVYGTNAVIHGDPHYPISVTIQTSTGCNRKCSYCPVSQHPAEFSVITADALELICKRLCEFGWHGVVDVIHYNEPLLNRNLGPIVSKIKERVRCTMHVTTNGDALTRDRAWELICSGVSQFNVTRHPPHSDKWDRQMAEVMEEWPGFVHLLQSPGDEGWTNRGGLVSIPGPNAVLHSCQGTQSLVLSMDCKVLLCCNDFRCDNVVGDLTTHSISDIYYAPEVVARRSELRRGIAKLPICQRCMEKVVV